MARRSLFVIFLLVIAAGIGSLGATGSGIAAADANAYQLVWADEFNKEGPLDPKDWNFRTGLRAQ